MILIGLPGCGISSLEPILLAELKKQGLQQLGSQKDACFLEEEVWTVINVSERLPDSVWVEDYLSQCLACSNAVVFMFIEQADLNKQMAWQGWIKNRIEALSLNKLPCLRCLNGQFSQNWCPRYMKARLESKHVLGEESLPSLETFEFSVSRLHLEHFFSSLDALRQNMGVNIVRVSGKVQITESLEPVAIEVTALEMKTYPLKLREMLTHKIKIQGVNLEREVLQDVIKACQLV